MITGRGTGKLPEDEHQNDDNDNECKETATDIHTARPSLTSISQHDEATEALTRSDSIHHPRQEAPHPYVTELQSATPALLFTYSLTIARSALGQGANAEAERCRADGRFFRCCTGVTSTMWSSCTTPGRSTRHATGPARLHARCCVALCGLAIFCPYVRREG